MRHGTFIFAILLGCVFAVACTSTTKQPSSVVYNLTPVSAVQPTDSSSNPFTSTLVSQASFDKIIGGTALISSDRFAVFGSSNDGRRYNTENIWVGNINTGEIIQSYQGKIVYSSNLYYIGILSGNKFVKVISTIDDSISAEFNIGNSYPRTVSPHGKYFVAVEENGRVKLYNTSTGKEVNSLDCDPHTFYRDTITFSNDERFIAIKYEMESADSTSGRVRVWDTTTGIEVIYEEKVMGVAFSDNGEVFAIAKRTEGMAGEVYTVDLSNMQTISRLFSKSVSWELFLSPSGKLVIFPADSIPSEDPGQIGNNTIIQVADVRTGNVIESWQQSVPMRDAKFSADETIVIVTNGPHIYIYDTHSNQRKAFTNLNVYTLSAQFDEKLHHSISSRQDNNMFIVEVMKWEY